MTFTALDGYGGLSQYIRVENLPDSESCTFSLRYRNGGNSDAFLIVSLAKDSGESSDLIGGKWFPSSHDDFSTAVYNFTRDQISGWDMIVAKVQSVDVGSMTISHPVLLPGSYTAKTLPPWEDIDSVVNLIRCRDYYRALSAYGFVGIAVADTTNSVQGVIFGEQMRIFNPSILGDFAVYTPTSSTNITAFNGVSYQGNGFRFSAQTTGGIAISAVGFLAPIPNSGAISADI